MAYFRFVARPWDVTIPALAKSVVTTGSWNTKPKAKINVMIKLKYSDTLGSKVISTASGWPICCVPRKNNIA
eukprot:CAMPEP_0195270236 /NCGR_PEP_ID=MMETSP0706-20130129/14228_1 /TAXON_ID=33640 /ORGANISM="Asterionellopsis glacialis, Strain CCMP134" /LENGTH=71 /DNA_ID=CAMNT_0040325465 /DNA_START=97 /DNA_END=308 /DNA_ORIENTATION=-